MPRNSARAFSQSHVDDSPERHDRSTRKGATGGGQGDSRSARRFTAVVRRNPKSGLGDVVADVGDHVVAAECKGGIINTRHPGQVSRLYRGLCETVGLLMATPSQGRQGAVVPL